MLNDLRNSFRNDRKKIFYIICILFALMLTCARMYGDDIDFMRVEGGTIAAYWKRSVEMYSVASSRLLVNFVVYLFTGSRNTLIWAIYMGISLYVLMYSFSKLFGSEGNEKKCNIVIAGLIMQFPFQYLNSAGWIATMTTYLSPAAFGVLSLLPIKKVFEKKRLAWFEYLIFSLSLIYGANHEQMMVVILGSYLTASLCLIWKKRLNIYILFQLLLAVLSFLFILLCPGNYARREIEITAWYKNWGMLNIIDKMDLGYSTTMQNILFGSHVFVIVICCLFTYIIWKKYKKTSYLMLAGIPASLMVLFGPLVTVVAPMYPRIYALTEKIEGNGLVTVANRGDLKAFGRYLIWAVLTAMILAAVILLQDSLKMLIASVVLLGAGTASRLVLGFSPTVYGSGERTFTIMYLCIIAVGCYVYCNSVEQGYLKTEESRKIEILSVLFIICSMINILFLVATV